MSYFKVRENCPACNSGSSKKLYEAIFTEPPMSTYLEDFYNPQGGVEFRFLQGESFVLDECNNCGLIYQRYIPDDFLMTKLYEEWIDPEAAIKHHFEQRKPAYFTRLAKEVEMIINHFSVPPRDLSLFDFGSGWGSWCQMAKAYGCNVVGTELSETRIEYTEKLGIPMIEWDDIPSCQFDFINTEQVFEHIAEPLKTLKHLIFGLKPEGVIKISVPNGGNIKKLLTIMDWKAPKGSVHSLNAVAPLEHINCFSEEAIITMAEKVGLKPVQIQATQSSRPFRLLDSSLRDVLRPVYRALVKNRKVGTTGSTYLFFTKQ